MGDLKFGASLRPKSITQKAETDDPFVREDCLARGVKDLVPEGLTLIMHPKRMDSSGGKNTGVLLLTQANYLSYT